MRIIVISDVKRVLAGRAKKEILAGFLNKLPTGEERSHYILLLSMPIEPGKDYRVYIEETSARTTGGKVIDLRDKLQIEV